MLRAVLVVLSGSGWRAAVLADDRCVGGWQIGYGVIGYDGTEVWLGTYSSREACIAAVKSRDYGANAASYEPSSGSCYSQNGQTSVGYLSNWENCLFASETCALYIAGPVVASKGNQVATVDSLQDYVLTFTMELASDWSITGEWQSVLYIGDAEWWRFPHVSFHRTGGLQVVQSHSYCTSCCCQYGVDYVIPPGGAFEAGGTYEIKIIVEDNQMAVYVDGALFGTASGSATDVATDANVYVGAPWYDASKVTLSDITLSEVALARSRARRHLPGKHCRYNCGDLLLRRLQEHR